MNRGVHVVQFIPQLSFTEFNLTSEIYVCKSCQVFTDCAIVSLIKVPGFSLFIMKVWIFSLLAVKSVYQKWVSCDEPF